MRDIFSSNKARKSMSVMTAAIMIAVCILPMAGMLAETPLFSAGGGNDDAWRGNTADWYSNDQAFEGSGSGPAPYIIRDGAQLALLAKIINDGTESSKYNSPSTQYQLADNILLNDISLVNVWSDGLRPKNMWTPIGNASNLFNANFDGAGFTISGLYISMADNYIDLYGLFGYIDNGHIKDLGITDSYIKGNIFTGAIAGYVNSGTIDNCYSTGRVNGSNSGGIAGYIIVGTVSNCYNTGNVTGKSYSGGIVGYLDRGTVSNCYNTGNVTGEIYSGGIVGSVGAVTIENCYSTGNVTGEYSGGIVGAVPIGGTVTGCHSTGNVTGKTSSGGIVGNSSGDIINSYNAGNINGNGSGGGIVGQINIGTVSNCHNTGSVNDSINSGGIVGFTYGDVINCYNTGSVNGSSSGGGIAGAVPMGGTVSNCYNTGSVNGSNYSGGIAGASTGGEVTNCYNTGNVTCTYINNMGSIVGFNAGGTVTDCHALIGSNAILVGFGTYSDCHFFHNDGTLELIWDGTAASSFAGGTGTPSDPFIISNGAELKYLSNQVSSPTYNSPGVCYRLANNIVLNDTANWMNWSTTSPDNPWVPIGDSVNKFLANFDGAGFTISGIYINTTSGDQGLFGHINGGTVKNLGITESYIKGGNAGAIAGYVDGGTVANCYNTGNITGTSLYAGGIVAFNGGTVTNCYNTGNIAALNSAVAGGIASAVPGTVTNCYNTGYVTGTDSGAIAGAVSGTVSNCFALLGSNRDLCASGAATSSYFFGSNWYIAGISADLLRTLNDWVDSQGDPDLASWQGRPPSFIFGDASGDVILLDVLNDYVDNYAGPFKLSSWRGTPFPELLPYWPRSIWNGTSASSFAGGTGISSDPFLISNGEELAYLQSVIQTNDPLYTNPSVYYRLVSDIVLNDTSDWMNWSSTPPVNPWVPIGSTQFKFSANFDGAGFTVSGIYINTTDSFQGLFGRVDTGTVKNLGITESYIEGNQFVGGITGIVENGGIVADCYNTGNVTGITTINPDTYAGGITGIIETGGTVTNCYNTGNVAGTNLAVGGISGFIENGTMDNCYNTGNVTGIGGEVGGIVGICRGGNVYNSYNTGNVTGSDLIGGIAGTVGSFGIVANCYNTGKVTTSGSYAGGIIGFIYTATVINCYALIGSSVKLAGGGGTFHNCYFFDDYGSVIGYVPGIWSGNTASSFRRGTGTASDPYRISKGEELAYLATLMGDPLYNSSSVYYRLTGDIVLNDTSDWMNWDDTTTGLNPWTPIDSFEANFDGAGFKISGIYTSSTLSNRGLFGYIPGGTVKNLGVTESYIKGNSFVGAIAGFVYFGGTVANCYNTGKVIGEDKYVGGIAGNIFSGFSVYNCYNAGNVTGSQYAGGIAGSSEGNIRNSYNTGKITGSNYLGGITGVNNGVMINCCNTGTINSTSSDVGSIAGQNTGTITNCYAFLGSHASIVGSGTNTGNYFFDAVGDLQGTTGTLIDALNGWVIGEGDPDMLFWKGNPPEFAYGGPSGTATLLNVLNSYVDSHRALWLAPWKEEPFPKLSIGSPGIWDGNTNPPVIEPLFRGSGTENDPYIIGSAEDLALLAKVVNEAYLSGTYNSSGIYYRLDADIYLNDTSNWAQWGTTPPANTWISIGGPINKFLANFDGADHEVHGIYISTASQFQGLFGYVDGGHIKNIGVTESYIKGGANTGGITGFAGYCIITDCYNKSTVIGDGSVGGIAGRAENVELSRCFNTGIINGNGSNDFVGGIAGLVSGTITDCYNTGNVTGGSSNTGGIAGQLQNVTVTGCYNTGNVTGGSSNTGGIAGQSQSGTVTGCYNTGNVTGGSSNTGGIIGFVGSGGTVTGCYNTGNVEVAAGSHTGGIAGSIHSNGAVANCYNAGDVSGRFNVGGIAGMAVGISINCYNAGNVNGHDGNNIGGIIGLSDNRITNCYNTGNVSGMNASSVGGIAGSVGNIGAMTNCYNTGDVSGTSTNNIGAIAGSVASGGAVTNCYAQEGLITDLVASNSGGILTDILFFDAGGLLSAPVTIDSKPYGNVIGALKAWVSLNYDKDDEYPYLMFIEKTTENTKIQYMFLHGDPNVTITYDNNGSGTITGELTISGSPGDTFTVKGTGQASRPGYVLKEWNTDPNGSGDPYVPGDTTAVFPSEDTKLYAIWELQPYYITITPTVNGSVISDKTNPVFYTDTVTITITADPGYTINTIENNNTDVSSSITSTGTRTWTYEIPPITSDITIEVTFGPTLAFTNSGTGTVTITTSNGNHTVNAGQTVTIATTGLTSISFDYVPSASETVTWIVNGVGVSTSLTYTPSSVPSGTASSIIATFNIIIDPTANGTATADRPNPVTSGETVNVLITPAFGYKIKELKDNGLNISLESLMDNGDGTWTYSILVNQAHTISLTFGLKTYSVVLTSGTGYDIGPDALSSSPVDHGGSFTFEIDVISGFDISEIIVKLNGIPVTLTPRGSGWTYTISNITENIVVTVENVLPKVIIFKQGTGTLIIADTAAKMGDKFEFSAELEKGYVNLVVRWSNDGVTWYDAEHVSMNIYSTTSPVAGNIWIMTEDAEVEPAHVNDGGPSFGFSLWWIMLMILLLIILSVSLWYIDERKNRPE